MRPFVSEAGDDGSYRPGRSSRRVPARAITRRPLMHGDTCAATEEQHDRTPWSTTVLVIGRGSGIARAVAEAARAAGAQVVVAGRDGDKLASDYDDPGVSSEIIDRGGS